MNRFNLSLATALLLASPGLLPRGATQAALTWDNAGPTNNWSTAAGNGNWLPGNVVWTNGEDAIFGATAESVAVTTANTVDDITFGASWTITNGIGNLTLADSNSDITVTNAADTATIGETIAGVGLGITKLGAGTLSLTIANSFSGNITVDAGTLRGTAVGSFGSASNTRTITVNNGGTLDFQANGVFGGAASTGVPTLVINAGGTVTNGGGPTRNNPLNNVTLNGGTLTATTDNGATWRSWNINGTITSTGNSLISAGTAPNPGIMLESAGSSPWNTDIDVQSGTLTISAPIVDGRNAGSPFASHTTSLTKLGDGTLTLTSTGLYTGATNVNDGTMLVNGSLAAASAVTVAGGATVGGTGTINGSVTVNSTGTFAPGSNSIDQINVASMLLNGDLLVEVLASAIDRVDVAGLLNLSGATDSLTISGTLTDPVYLIAGYGSHSGTFNTLNNLQGYTVDYNYLGTNQIALIAPVAVVPAPAALPAGLALLGLAAARRRR